MKSALALLSLVASATAAETVGAACTAQAGCTASQCCAYWKDNDPPATLKSTCQTAPATDVLAQGTLIAKEGLTVKTGATFVDAAYACMAASKPCPTDNSATEC